ERDVLDKVGLRVTTLGPKGVEIVGADGTALHVAAAPEASKHDPTGIGDGFRGGFLGGLRAGLGVERAAQLGSVIAVLVLETVGTQEWLYERADVLRRADEAYGPEAAEEIGGALPAA
ncbi:MAG: PfkB family carbohydrate kinase, partial [Thermocrispum sp.]